MSSNFKKFLLLWTGELISSIGGGLTSFGLGVYIFKTTGSAAGMALVTLCGFLPTLLLSVPAGVLADRYDRRLLMMLGDGCSALGLVYILISMLRGDAGLFQICAGVFVSAVFSALLEPAYKATVTDLLSKDEYSRASGLMSMAGSARYLFSPVLAGFLLTVSDVKLLLLIDIFTFFFTVLCAAVVRRGIASNTKEDREPFISSIKDGWNTIISIKGLPALVLASAFVTFFLGIFQVLAEPFILSLFDEKTLGIAETICACGMLISAVILGIFGIKKGYVKLLGFSFALAGVSVFLFSLTSEIVIICLSGFLFFASLPVSNNCLDFLTRSNIPDDAQGRAWGLIGFLSQTGYAVAYAVSGFTADFIGSLTGLGSGRGSAMVISFSGVMMVVMAVVLYSMKSVRELE